MGILGVDHSCRQTGRPQLVRNRLFPNTGRRLESYTPRTQIPTSYNCRMTPRTRRAIAVGCIALVVFVAFSPGLATEIGSAILVPLGLVVPAVVATCIRRKAFRCDQQPVA